MSNSELFSKFGEISFQEYVFGGMSHQVVYVDLVFKLKRVKRKANCDLKHQNTTLALQFTCNLKVWSIEPLKYI